MWLLLQVTSASFSLCYDHCLLTSVIPQTVVLLACLPADFTRGGFEWLVCVFMLVSSKLGRRLGQAVALLMNSIQCSCAPVQIQCLKPLCSCYFSLFLDFNKQNFQNQVTFLPTFTKTGQQCAALSAKTGSTMYLTLK